MTKIQTLLCGLFCLLLSSPAFSMGSKANTAACNVADLSADIAQLVGRYVPSGANGRSAAAAVYRFDEKGVRQQTLYARNSSVSQAVASVQKIVTAWTAYRQGSLSRKVEFVEGDLFYDEQGNRAQDSKGRVISPGHQMSLSNYIRTLMVQSSNGAGQAIARGSMGSVNAFVAQMNAEVDAIFGEGAKSFFQNPHGLTDEDARYRFAGSTRRQLSTAGEMASFMGYTMSDKDFRKMLDKAGVPGAKGSQLIKFGNTQAAGKTVIGTFPLGGDCAGQMASYAFFGASDSEQFNRFRALHSELRDLVLDSLP
jgi:D-alanyl-D-alanine carboxypeptidase